MMKKRMIISSLLLTFCLFQQLFAQEILLEKKFPNGNLRIGAVLPDGYLVIGNYEHRSLIDGTYRYKHEPFLMRLDGSLNVVWEKKFPKRRHEGFKDMVVDGDAIYILGTQYGRPVEGRAEAWLLKLNLDGVQTWERFIAYPDFNTTEACWLRLLPDGDLITMTRAFRYNSSLGDQWLLRFDSQGKEIWNKKMSEDQYYSSLGNAMVTPRGTLLMNGSTYTERADFSKEVSLGYMVELDPDNPNQPGKSKTFRDFHNMGFGDIMELDNGHFWATGRFEPDATSTKDFGILMQMDKDWNIIRNKPLGYEKTFHLSKMAWNPQDQRICLFGTIDVRGDAVGKHIQLSPNFQIIRDENNAAIRVRSVTAFSNGEVLAVARWTLQIVR